MKLRWRKVLDIAILVVTVYRVVVAYSVDVAMAFKYPLALDGCVPTCSSALCRVNCHLRAALHLDLEPYVRSGVDPVSAALQMPIRIMTGFYFVAFAPFLVLLTYSLFTRREAIRTPAIAMGVLISYLMGSLIIQVTWGDPPSTNVALFFAYNAVDVLAPILILLRTIPRPLFTD